MRRLLELLQKKTNRAKVRFGGVLCLRKTGWFFLGKQPTNLFQERECRIKKVLRALLLQTTEIFSKRFYPPETYKVSKTL